LNARLNGMLPGGPVAYETHENVGDLQSAIDQAREDYYKAAAPPESVLAKALYVVRRKGTIFGGAPSIVYILKKQSIFGIEICTGWSVSQSLLGGPPEGNYIFGACGGEKFTPSGGLPTLPPKPGN
jgi:hypothetical protein